VEGAVGEFRRIIQKNYTNHIINSIKHIDESISRIREVLPGREYFYPPVHDKIDFLSISEQQFYYSFINFSNSSISVEVFLSDKFNGISRLFSHQICLHCNINPNIPISHIDETSSSILWYKLNEIIHSIKDGITTAYVVISHDKPIDFHKIFLKDYPKECIIEYCSMNESVDAYYISKFEYNKVIQIKESLSTIVKQGISKLEKKINILDTRIKESSNWEDLKLYGQLLSSYLYKITPAAEEISIENYYSPDSTEITIKLDKNLSPSQNVQKYFKLYNKKKTTFEISTKQLQGILNELEYLEGILFELDNCSLEIELSEIRNELISQGIILEDKKSKNNIPNTPSQPILFTHNGFEIYVGKNNRQNDRLTLKTASAKDIWLHTQKIHGSHVIIRTKDLDVPYETILYAANLAAYFSKARLSSNVPVDYTKVKYVKKPSGAKPGMVIYENQKTIYITPTNPYSSN
jgi:predicted ribosome quality control (RQC) complex YloA/Tae2 family protein